MPDIHIPESLHGACISIGNFDGVHQGHVSMLQQLIQLARQLCVPAAAVTFDPHPIAVLRPEFTPPLLTTPEERRRLLLQAGLSAVFVLPVSASLLQLTPQQFFSQVIQAGFQAGGVVEGPNFHFGHDRAGNVDTLQQLCQDAGIACHIAAPADDGSEMISSSRIRSLLCRRAVTEAVKLLGHPYRISGFVHRGAQRGRTIGFPTANLAEIHTLLPAHGVYAGTANIQGHTFPAAVSVGPNPTFGEQREKIEVHLDGFSGDLYGTRLNVDLLAEIRPLQAFSSASELVARITADVAEVRKLAATAGH
ncbi:MAG: bifunctional riboflavin kinase/FAD synthetase [Planctomyces sp.]